MKKEIYEDRIAKIERMLEDDNELSNYIRDLESNEMFVPKGLKEKITTQINKEEIKKKASSKPKNNKFAGIAKIVACTLFALVIWQASLSKPLEATATTQKIDTKQNIVIENISKAIDNVSHFLMRPLDLNKEGK